MKSAVTISLVQEAKGGPFVFWDDFEAACETAAELGFDAVELFPPSAEEINSATIQKALSNTGLKLAAVGSGGGWIKRQLRLTDPDLHIRRQSIQFINHLIDFAGNFEAPVIIGSMQGRWGEGIDRDQALAWFAEALEELGPKAHATGSPLLYEPLNRYETNLFNHVDKALAFLGALQTQNVKLLCDLFHMNIEEASILDAITLAGPKLGHVHFADSNRRAPGFGHTPMRSVIDALRHIDYSGYLSAEIFPWPDAHTAAEQTIGQFKELTQPAV